ncbi:MAG: 16S rRNA (guanine(966)-N(2))-methyltransferase RsmD [Gammaproteobacteria bacterium]
MTNNFVRIIGGQWRSRRLAFPPIPGLRPTPDRVRETLFNWLAQFIHGARCLDVFAGSGAMGFEALSRGASHAVFLDTSRSVVDALIKNAQLLKTTDYDALCVDSLKFLAKKPDKPFDIIFLDPPYSLNLLGPCLTLLSDNQFLKPTTLIYVEDNQPILDFPGFKKHKESKASSVHCALLVQS